MAEHGDANAERVPRLVDIVVRQMTEDLSWQPDFEKLEVRVGRPSST